MSLLPASIDDAVSQYTSSVTDQTRNMIRAFLHGITGAGLFRRLTYPGAPTHFVDPRPVEVIVASGEFDELLRKVQERKGQR
jgi:hypothetical protein